MHITRPASLRQQQFYNLKSWLSQTGTKGELFQQFGSNKITDNDFILVA